MATKWLKLEGATAELFELQYADMLKQHPDISKADFPPEMFVRYLLDIRQKSLDMKRVSIKLPTKEVTNDHTI